MAKRRKNRKKSLAQLKAELEGFKERNMMLMLRALGRLSCRKMTKRNRKRQKDARNHWSKEWE
jgi:hypothetical protein